MNRAARIAAVVLLVLAGCAYEPGPLSERLSGAESGTVWFESVDAYDFTTDGAAPPIAVEGDLTIPDPHNGAAVVLSHGSAGVGALHRGWARTLQGWGYATLTLDHFSPREVINTLHAQVRVTEQQMALDILNAVRLLESHPDVAPGSVRVMGWSKGGTAGLLAAFDPVQRLAGFEPPALAAAVLFYPYCNFRGEIPAETPITILHGTADDWTPIDFCRTFMRDLSAAGAAVTLTEIEDGLHGFDNWTARRGERPRSVTIREASPRCTLRLAPDLTATRSLDGTFGVASFDARRAFLEACAERGVTYGGSPEARATVEVSVRAALDP
ncbi:MAG: dienelactone hydrolase family protein [Marivibrio sp.]|uniref:dienelactone hydrolase family protein n=1 Tax=Marivibrio sp. TaxID=2039719 RepID=UPI0032EDA0CD